jgi:hypothetical protein
LFPADIVRIHCSAVIFEGPPYEEPPFGDRSGQRIVGYHGYGPNGDFAIFEKWLHCHHKDFRDELSPELYGDPGRQIARVLRWSDGTEMLILPNDVEKPVHRDELEDPMNPFDRAFRELIKTRAQQFSAAPMIPSLEYKPTDAERR